MAVTDDRGQFVRPNRKGKEREASIGRAAPGPPKRPEIFTPVEYSPFGTTVPVPDDGIPDRPGGSIPKGFEWVWNPDTEQWDLQETEDSEDREGRENQFDRLRGYLEQWGLESLADWVWGLILDDTPEGDIMRQLRDRPEYHSAFPENRMRREHNLQPMAESEILAYRNDARELLQRHGHGTVSNNYLSEAMGRGVSLSELEHRLGLVDSVQRLGPFVRAGLEQELGIVLSDEDLFEFFDGERSTKDWDDAYRNARLKNQPIAFGLDPRSQAEIDALGILGITDEEALTRYQQMGQEKPRFDRLQSIAANITDGLPADFGGWLAGVDNDLQRDAILFNRPDALAQLQSLWIQEQARNKGGGGVAGGGAGFLPAGQR